MSDITITHPLDIITNRNEHYTVRAVAVLDLIRSTPNSRSRHHYIRSADIEVYNRPTATGASVFVEAQDMETYLHIVGVVTREAAQNGYSVDVHQNGWNVQFKITAVAS
jgi:hypothetical protein